MTPFSVKKEDIKIPPPCEAKPAEKTVSEEEGQGEGEHHSQDQKHRDKCNICQSKVNTVQYSTVQYSIVKYSTVQYGTVQYSTVQYSTVQTTAPRACTWSPAPSARATPSPPRRSWWSGCSSALRDRLYGNIFY